MTNSGKVLFLEAMSLDESNELLPATKKYLEALIQFGTSLLDMSQSESEIDIKSKSFADQTKAAMQCLDRVYAIHQHFQKPLTLAPSSISDTAIAQKLSPSTSSTMVLKHTDTIRAPPVNSSNSTDPLSTAIENNKRLKAQLSVMVKRKQLQHQPLTDAQVAALETALQRKMTENLAVAYHEQKSTAIPAGTSYTLPRDFGRKSKSDNVLGSFGMDQTIRPSRKIKKSTKEKKSNSHSITQWPSLGPSDRLSLGVTLGEKWRSKSGDRSRDHRSRSDNSSVFEESDFSSVLDDGDSDNEVPPPSSGNLLPTIEEMFGEEQCSKLSAEQRQQQLVIVELIYTERTHVRSLKVLQKLFYRPLSRSNILPRNFVSYMPMTFLELLFANLDEIVDFHSTIGKALKSIPNERHIVYEIGKILCEFFDGEFSEKFKIAVAQFCQHQQFALEQLELRRQQDHALANMLKMAESHPACHGFMLRDMLPNEMQRVSKYPLLFERILKYADKGNAEEIERLQRCLTNAQQILSYMNQSKRDFENSKKLAEICSRLDTSPFYRFEHPLVNKFRTFNIQKQGYIFDGPLRMRRMDNTVIELHGVLCDDILVLLTKRGLGSDERLCLQFHQENVLVSARQHMLVEFCPIIVLADAKLKDAASCNKDFYIISTTNEVTLYHLETPEPEFKLSWLKHIQAQIDKLSMKSDGGTRDGVNGASHSDGFPTLSVNGIPQLHDTIDVNEYDNSDDADFDEFSDDEEEPVREEVNDVHKG